MTPLIYLLIGLALGGAIGWLLRAFRQPEVPPDSRVESELRQQLSQRERELTQTREQLTQAKSAHASAEAKQVGAEKLLAEQRQLHEKVLVEAKMSQEKALADLREAFKALSAHALKQTQPAFLRLATEPL